MTAPATRQTTRRLDEPVRARGTARLLAAVVVTAAGLMVLGGGSAGGVGTDSANPPTPAWEELVHAPQLVNGRCQPTNPPGPPCRSHAAMAYDPIHRYVVLFGGDSYGSALGDTWIWDGKSWRPPRSQAPPPPLTGSAMAFDGRRIVRFGGRNGGQVNNFTWIWDGTSETWTKLSPPLAPPARTSTSMAEDGSGVVVLFGGVDNATELNDTWIWDGQTETWSPDLRPTTLGPRDSAAMAYDPAHRYVLLYGGSNFATGYASDTWTWTQAQGWMPPPHLGVTAAGACKPIGLVEDPETTFRKGFGEAAMSYDAVSAKMVMFGGLPGGELGGVQAPTGIQDTWIFDGATWSLIDPCALPTGLPDPRHGASMAPNPSDAPGKPMTVVLFGGISGRAWDDTWMWTGQAPSPPATTTTSTSTTSTTISPLRGAVTTTTVATRVHPPPAVQRLLPPSGPVNGGTPITIVGSGFLGATTVKFGGTALDCTKPDTCSVLDDSRVKVTSPPHAAGTVDVVVRTTAGGASSVVRNPGTADDEFTYFPPSVFGSQPVFGSSGFANGPAQPSQPAPPGGFSAAPAPPTP
ncbi:MAG: IPT/TIG domain-containing protein, partial [Actinomycetota bacterium]|nr:IPT/TIG domain-containing protein [Actinomycetota bacterium]